MICRLGAINALLRLEGQCSVAPDLAAACADNMCSADGPSLRCAVAAIAETDVHNKTMVEFRFMWSWAGTSSEGWWKE